MNCDVRVAVHVVGILNSLMLIGACSVLPQPLFIPFLTRFNLSVSCKG